MTQLKQLSLRTHSTKVDWRRSSVLRIRVKKCSIAWRHLDETLILLTIKTPASVGMTGLFIKTNLYLAEVGNLYQGQSRSISTSTQRNHSTQKNSQYLCRFLVHFFMYTTTIFIFWDFFDGWANFPFTTSETRRDFQ